MLEIELDALEEVVMSETRDSGAPKYACVQEAFEKCIRSGRFKPGARVPSEVELSQRLPVGLGTIQRALAELAQRGIVVRSRKTGTFIADRDAQADVTHVYRFKDPATGKMLLPFTRVLQVKVDRTSGPWRDAFGGKRLVRIDRLVWVEQSPPAFSSVYVDFKHGKHLLKQPIEQLHGTSWHSLLIERFNLPTLRMEHKFGCRQLDSLACRSLLVPEDTLGIVWNIEDFSFEDQPILFQSFQLPPAHRPIELTEWNAKRYNYKDNDGRVQ